MKGGEWDQRRARPLEPDLDPLLRLPAAADAMVYASEQAKTARGRRLQAT